MQTAAEAEYKKTTRVLESAYTHKVEEAAVLRRECAKLQETVEALKLGMTKSASDLQNELGHARRESLDQAQVLEVDVQVNIDIFMSANYVHIFFFVFSHQFNSIAFTGEKRGHCRARHGSDAVVRAVFGGFCCNNRPIFLF